MEDVVGLRVGQWGLGREGGVLLVGGGGVRGMGGKG